jgi:hypothetical protein
MFKVVATLFATVNLLIVIPRLKAQAGASGSQSSENGTKSQASAHDLNL